MSNELGTILVVVVFAGGPHTATRLELARALLRECRPEAVFLTGREFTEAGRPPEELLGGLVEPERILTDETTTTLSSCAAVSHRIRRQFPRGARIVAITSNYHAPRVRWLFGGFLPRTCKLELHTSTDLTPGTWFRTPLGRHLIRGEALSWLYGLPVGLLLRPFPLAGAALVLALALRLRKGIRSRARV